MKNNIKILIGAFLILFSVSCSDFLDTTEPHTLTPEEAFADVNLLNAAVLGIYDRMQEVGYYGRNYMVIPEIASDNAKINVNNSGRFIQEYNFSMIASSGDAESVFDAAYEVIHGACSVIDNIGGCELCTEDESKRALAHAYGLRALAHFDLLKLYAFPYNLTDAAAATGANGQGGNLGVPIITTSIPDPEPARNTVAEVYAQIIDDLLISINHFDGLAYEGGTYFSSAAAKALLARVYLYMDDYQNARTYANEVLNSGQFNLVTNANYLDSWNGVGSSETIFEVGFTSTDYASTNCLGYIYNGYKDVLASDNLVNTFDADDVRLGLYEPYNDTYQNIKYEGRDGILGLANSPVVRLSEMYLIKAEAEAKIGGMDASAIQALDAIKQRANPGAAATTLSGEALIEEILLERRKELAFEGLRLFDLLRTKQGVHRDASDIIGSAPQDVNYPAHKLIFPIPETEVEVNANMVQNLGY